MGNSEEDGYEWINRVNRGIDSLGLKGMTILVSIVMLIWALIDGSGSLYEIIMFTAVGGFLSAFIIIVGWAFISGLGKTIQTGIIILLIAALLEGTGLIDLP